MIISCQQSIKNNSRQLQLSSNNRQTKRENVIMIRMRNQKNDQKQRHISKLAYIKRVGHWVINTFIDYFYHQNDSNNYKTNPNDVQTIIQFFSYLSIKRIFILQIKSKPEQIHILISELSMASNFDFKNNHVKRSLNRQFKLPVQDSIKIIDEVRKIQKHAKYVRPDEDRKQYQQLLQWVNVKLEATKLHVQSKNSEFKQSKAQTVEKQTLQEEVQIQQRKIIQTLMQQMVEKFKKQCKEKSQLMQVCFQYFNQLINLYARHYEKQFTETLKAYNINLTQIEEGYQQKLTEFNEKITFLEGQKQTKWKNIYMLAKDNRILRRQKGKLLRNIQQQEQKIKILQQQLCQIAKQNQLNKLIIRFQNDSENLQIFMKNRLTLIKFQKIIQRYPKRAMKVLNNDLIKLQIQQLNSLDSKIDYIRRVIMQSGDVFDQYEDLNELINRPNNMVFNMYTQTQSEDIQPQKQFKDNFTSYQIQYISSGFERWPKICDIKITGYPQLKQKYVYFRNQHSKPASKSIKSKAVCQSDKKQFFVLQICRGQVSQVFNTKTHKRGYLFTMSAIIGVCFNPNQKKTKLYFINAFDAKHGSKFTVDCQIQGSDLIFRKTSPAKFGNYSGKKDKPTKRYNQTQLTQAKYAINRVGGNKLSILKRNGEALSSQNTVQGSRSIINQTIDEKSQFGPQNPLQDAQNTQNISNQQELNQNYLQKFKKTRRLARKTQDSTRKYQTKLESSRLQSQGQQNGNKANEVFSVNIYQNKQTKLQRLSTQVSSERKSKGSMNSGRTGRVKTAEDEINSSQKKENMDFIYEQQQQSEDNQGFSQDKNKPNYRLSYKQPANNHRNSKFMDTMNGFINSKVNQMNPVQNMLAEKDKKKDLTVQPNIMGARKTLTKLNTRNSSPNMMRLNARQSANVDTCSMNSFVSSQNQSTFTQKNVVNQIKPKDFIQSLQCQNPNPVYIKPFQVKKLAQKIIKIMYTRRKQLLSNPAPSKLKTFIQYFLKQIYGNDWKGDKNLLRYTFTIDDRENSSNLRVFTLLLNANVHTQYLEDLFRLYLTMLDKSEFRASENSLITNKNKGLNIIKYLLSIYFDQTTSTDIQQSLSFMDKYQIDLNDIFMAVQTQIRKHTLQTQIYSFIQKLMPENISNLQFCQFKQILFVFKNQSQKYHLHIARLKYFFKANGEDITQQQTSSTKLENTKTGRKSSSTKLNFNAKDIHKSSLAKQAKQEVKTDIQILPLHRVCLYLKRYQWNEVIDINTFIEEKYHKMKGVFVQEQSIKFIIKYCSIISIQSSDKKPVNQIGMTSIPVSQARNTDTSPVHPLSWLLQRAKQLIRNYYRYQTHLDRYLLMFLHVSIITCELQTSTNDVLSETLSLINLQYKRLKTKEQVDTFLRH